MRFYTKEWYELMQRQNYTAGMKKIPDCDYTDDEIQKLFLKMRKRFIEREKRCYNEPPYLWSTDDFPAAALFDGNDPDTGEDIYYISELIGAEASPKSREEFSAYLALQYEENMRKWEQRAPFDSKRSGEIFDNMYRKRCKYIHHSYPDWVSVQADMRLLAMNLMPESTFERLHKEELENRSAWRKIERKAERVLSKHREKLPKEITDGFRFHDAEVLTLQKKGRTYEMILNVEGAGGAKPYMKVTFIDVTLIEREPGIRLNVKHGENGEATSNCWYMYDELYSAPEGVEIHMLLNTTSLKYLTVRCRDVCFEPMQRII